MTRRIPLFPLPGVVLLPGTMLPLHIFEPRYRAMVADALAGDRMIGMAKLKPGWESAGEPGRPRGRGRRRDHRVRAARRRPLQHPAGGPIPIPHPQGGARRDSLPHGQRRRDRVDPVRKPGRGDARLPDGALPLRGDPASSSIFPRSRTASSPPSASLRRWPCGCATRPRSSRRCWRPTRSRRASATLVGRMLEWQRRIQFLAPFRPGSWTPRGIDRYRATGNRLRTSDSRLFLRPARRSSRSGRGRAPNS